MLCQRLSKHRCCKLDATLSPEAQLLQPGLQARNRAGQPLCCMLYPQLHHCIHTVFTVGSDPVQLAEGKHLKSLNPLFFVVLLGVLFDTASR
jgi:hypothetical protein